MAGSLRRLQRAHGRRHPILRRVRHLGGPARRMLSRMRHAGGPGSAVRRVPGPTVPLRMGFGRSRLWGQPHQGAASVQAWSPSPSGPIARSALAAGVDRCARPGRAARPAGAPTPKAPAPAWLQPGSRAASRRGAPVNARSALANRLRRPDSRAGHAHAGARLSYCAQRIAQRGFRSVCSGAGGRDARDGGRRRHDHGSDAGGMHARPVGRRGRAGVGGGSCAGNPMIPNDSFLDT